MSADSPEAIKKQVRKYIAVFAALATLTVVTVLASHLKVTVAIAVLIALLIASVKGSLVAGHFMHLFDERKIIYWVLAVCVIFFVALMALPVLTTSSNVNLSVLKNVP